MADISYTRTTWVDGSEGGTPIDATKLNNIEQGIVDAVAAIGPNDTTEDGTLKAQINALKTDKIGKPTAMTGYFDIWEDSESQWSLNVKTPNGEFRHLIFKENVIVYSDENYDPIITIS